MKAGCSARNWILCVCCLALLLPATSWAAQRMVMVEDFTSIYCTYCPAVGQALADIMDANPTQFVTVQEHSTFGGDPYNIAWTVSVREPYYGVNAYPTTVQDGILKRVGQYSAATYQADFTARKTVATDVTIRLGAGQLGTQRYRINAWVTLEPTGTAKTVRVYIAQLLDRFPSGGTHNRNCLRQIGMHGTAYYVDVPLTPGSTQTVTVEMSFSGDDWTNRTNMKLVAWAQKTGSFSSGSEIYQAATMNWPFLLDCNNNGIPDDQDIANGTSQDCNGNAIPDECDIRDCQGNPACGDCDGNGIPDSCDGYDLADCDGNGLADECELAHLNVDCNNNGIVDACDIRNGTSQDCNGNHIPDECDLANCNGEPWCDDCNHNGVLDYCDLVVHFAADSGHMTPFGAPLTNTYTLVNPPNALNTVTFVVTAFGDINYSNEYVDLNVNGTAVARLFTTAGYQDCTDNQTGTATMTADAYNAAKASGDVAVNLVPSTSVSQTQCNPNPSWISVAISYTGVPASADANMNGIPDECEQGPTPCPGDANCDGFVNFSDIDLFVAAIPDNEAAWSALYQARYGTTPTCAFLNNDCTADGHVNFSDIDPFVALIPSTCP